MKKKDILLIAPVIHIPMQDLCIHVIALIVTVQTLLDTQQSHFNTYYIYQQREQLTTSLLHGNCENYSQQFNGLSEGANICIVPKVLNFLVHEQPRICIIQDGLIVAPNDPNIAGPLSIITEERSFHGFITNFTLAAATSSIYICEPNGYRRVEWNKKLALKDITEINAIDTNTLRIQRTCMHDKMPINDITRIGDHLIVNNANNQLGYILPSEIKPWESANTWKTNTTILIDDNDQDDNVWFPTISEPFEIDTATFNNNGIAVPAITSNSFDKFVFKHNGVEVLPEDYTPQCKVVARQDEESPWSTAIESHITVDNTLTILKSLKHADKLIDIVRNCPRKLTVDKQQTMWMKSLLAATCAETEQELSDIINQTVHAFEQCYLDIEKTIKKTFVSAYSMLPKHMAGQIFFKDNAFYLAKVKYKKFWLMSAIPYMILCEYQRYYRYFDYQLLVNTSKFHASLIQLQALLSRHDINLYLNTKHVKKAHIDIEIDTTSNPDTDWFELHPDVYYKGEKLSDQEWQDIVAGKGFWTRGKDLLIIDTNVSSALNLLSRWINSQLDEKAKKNSIVIVPRLKILDLIELRKNDVKVKLTKKDETILQSLSHFTAIPKIKLPSQLQCTLRDYQIEGYHWLAFLYQHRFGACLADDMGLGKTVQAITLLGGIHEGIISDLPMNHPHLT